GAVCQRRRSIGAASDSLTAFGRRAAASVVDPELKFIGVARSQASPSKGDGRAAAVNRGLQNIVVIGVVRARISIVTQAVVDDGSILKGVERTAAVRIKRHAVHRIII